MSLKTPSYKQAKTIKVSRGNKSISSFALIGIAILAIFSFNNIIDNYTGLGLSSVVAFIVATIVYLLPFSFLIAEMASLQFRSKSNSGLTNWVNTCIGRKTSFITSYMFWFANLFYFVGAVPSRLNYIAFGFTGADYTQDATFNLVIPFVAIALFGVITWISTLNTRKISKFTNVGAWVIMGLTALFFAVAIIAWITGAIDPKLVSNTEAPGLIPSEKIDVWGDAGGINFLWMSTFIWVLMAADGAQSLGVYVNDVRGGRKSFSKAIIIAVLLIGFIYIFGTLLVSIFPPKIDGVGTLANNLVNSYFNMFYFMFQNVMDAQSIQRMTYIIIGLSYTFVLGGILVWTSAPVRTFFSEIPTGVFGSSLPKQNRNGSPVKGAWIQFIIVAPLLLIPALGIGELSKFFGFIKTSSGWIGMIPPLVIFIAYFNLRLKKDHLERSFRMGNRIFGLVVSGFMILVFIAILIITFLDVPLNEHPSKWGENWWLNVAYKVGCLLVLVVPIYLWYLRYEKILRETKIAKDLNLNDKLVLKKYSLSKKINQYFYIDLVKVKNEKINKLNEEFDLLFQEIDFSNKKESKQLYSQYKKTKKAKYQEIIAWYKNEVKLINDSLDKQIKEMYLLMNEELNKFKIFPKNNGKKSFDLKKYFELSKYRKNFSINLISNPNDDSYEENIDAQTKDLDIIYEAFGVKKTPIVSSKNVVDKLLLSKEKITLCYLVNDEYQEFDFYHCDSKIIFEPNAQAIERFSRGQKINLNLVTLISTKDNNVWIDSIYIGEIENFKKNYFSLLKDIGQNYETYSL